MQYKKQYIVNPGTEKETFYDELAEYLPTPTCYKERGAVYLVGKDHKYGLIDAEGAEIILPVYDPYYADVYNKDGGLRCGHDIIFNFTDGFLSCVGMTNWVLLTARGK